MAVALIVDWSGPFQSVESARDAARQIGLGEVLYLATGKRRYQRRTGLQYVGLSSDLKNRFNDKNHKISIEVTADLKIWVGMVMSQSIPGRPAKKAPKMHSRAIEQAEWMIAYFLAMPLNVKKRSRPPRDSSVLLSRWFKSDFATRRRHRGHPDWPDFVEFELDYETASLVWFGAPPRRRHLSKAEIAALARQKASSN